MPDGVGIIYSMHAKQTLICVIAIYDKRDHSDERVSEAKANAK
jgi:hypothetical protein